MENKQVKARMMSFLFKSTLFAWLRAIGIGEGLDPAWSFKPHHVDGSVWKALGYIICVCNHTRPRRGISKNLAL
jgi:hypothetical protein